VNLFHFVSSIFFQIQQPFKFVTIEFIPTLFLYDSDATTRNYLANIDSNDGVTYTSLQYTALPIYT